MKTINNTNKTNFNKTNKRKGEIKMSATILVFPLAKKDPSE